MLRELGGVNAPATCHKPVTNIVILLQFSTSVPLRTWIFGINVNTKTRKADKYIDKETTKWLCLTYIDTENIYKPSSTNISLKLKYYNYSLKSCNGFFLIFFNIYTIFYPLMRKLLCNF